MEKTKIEWCDSTWNPVTGCYHTCEYCYARAMINRFGSNFKSKNGAKIHELDTPILGRRNASEGSKKQPYPYNFEPTLHNYRLDDYKNKKGRTIFVCSMADLFGEWVPDKWIEKVFSACKEAPQHRYLFLTKNHTRYVRMDLDYKLPIENNMWYGVSITNKRQAISAEDSIGELNSKAKVFLSIEPILEDISEELTNMIVDFGVNWVIIGAETGNRKDRVVPEKEWINKIISLCEENSTPVFMKDSLIPIVGEENMIRDLPWRYGE